MLHHCLRAQLNAGDGLLLPCGTLHALAAPEDAILLAGRFWHPYSLHTPVRIWELQEQLGQKPAAQLPGFRALFWCALLHYAKQLRQFAGLPLLKAIRHEAVPRLSENEDSSLMRSSQKRKAADGQQQHAIDDYTSPLLKRARNTAHPAANKNSIRAAQTASMADATCSNPTLRADELAAAAEARRSAVPAARARPATSEQFSTQSFSCRPRRAAAAGVGRLVGLLVEDDERVDDNLVGLAATRQVSDGI